MNAQTFIIDIIDEHHDNIDGEPAGDGYENQYGSEDGRHAGVFLKFDDGTRLRVTVEDVTNPPSDGAIRRRQSSSR
jgi:hypothetical protein